jgi:predicted TIM-barrel fold metal-dependent hydrolase
MKRRRFLKIGTAASVAAAAQPASIVAAEKFPKIDAHLHCFAGASNSRFPYHDRAPYRPDDAATPEHLLKCMDGAGVDHAIVVHPEPYQDDHRYLEHCLEIGKGRLKGTCLFFADRPGSIAGMPELVKRAPIVAARVHAYAPDRLPPFGKPELRNLWKTASDLGLVVQIHFEPRYAPGFEPLIEEFSGTRVIIDHLGRPFQGTPDEHEVVVRWSRFQNTVIKLSSIPEQTSYPHRDIAPVIRWLVKEYGPERMIYGGGFSAAATPESYRASFDRAESFISELPESQRGMILGGNAATLFGFPA